MADGELDGVDPVEVVLGEAMQQARLMAGLDLQLLGHAHDQRAEQIDRRDAALFSLALERFDDLALDEGEHDERAHLRGELDHAADLGDRPRVAEHPQPPAVAELDHRRADGRAAGVAGPVGDDEHGHVAVLRGHIARRYRVSPPSRVPRPSPRSAEAAAIARIH